VREVGDVGVDGDVVPRFPVARSPVRSFPHVLRRGGPGPGGSATVPVILFAALLLPLLAGCTLSRLGPAEPAEGGTTLCCARGPEGITLQYLGVGGWLFRFGGDALLTAPFFSNPSLVDVGIGGISPDTAAIDRFLPPVGDVSTLLVGHGHYDHLMDVPYILRRHAPEARLFGSTTATNLVAGDPEIPGERLVAVDGRAGDHERAGEWIHLPGGRIRFMPLASGHAPHLFGIQLYRGEQAVPRDRLPGTAGDWVDGLTLAYLIDFLGPEGEVVFRIHYQDAASEPPDGFPPPLEDGIPVDLVILCPPGFEQVERYPGGILERTAPSLVLLGHWEDFFRARTEALRPVPTLDLEEFLERMEPLLPEGAEWVLPVPGAAFRVVGSG
jgi:glyoxylase-like metal-dependent hydrolase (beta-lactamase superfamily II)